MIRKHISDIHAMDIEMQHDTHMMYYTLEVNELVQSTFPLQVIIKIKIFVIIQPN